MKVLRSIGVAVVLAASLLFAVAQPAQAVIRGWQTFTTNSSWHCGATAIVGYIGFYAQVCNIKSSADYQQTVAVVSNRSAKAVVVDGSLASAFNADACKVTSIAVGAQLACFGTTAIMPACSHSFASATLEVDQDPRTSQDYTAPIVYAKC